MTLSKLAVSLMAVFGAASALAQSAPNPLMRPVAPNAASSAPGALRTPSMPPVPGMSDVAGRNDKSDERARAVQTALARFNVVAIQDDTAILRVTTADGQSAGAPSGPAAGAAQGEPAGGGSASKDVNYGVLPSLVVKHKQKLMIQDVAAIVEVQSGEVSIRLADGTRALYMGRLDGNSKVNRGVALTPTDPAYTSRQSPPVGGTSAPGAGGSQGQARTGGTGQSQASF